MSTIEVLAKVLYKLKISEDDTIIEALKNKYGNLFDYPPLDPDQTIERAIEEGAVKIVDIVRRTGLKRYDVKNFLDERGITVINLKYSAIKRAREKGAIEPKDIADEIGMSCSSVNRYLNSIEPQQTRQGIDNLIDQKEEVNQLEEVIKEGVIKNKDIAKRIGRSIATFLGNLFCISK